MGASQAWREQTLPSATSRPLGRARSRIKGERTKTRLREALAREVVLLRRVEELIHRQEDLKTLLGWQGDAGSRFAQLTPRQRQIMELVLAGQPSKKIAADLGLSQRTVEGHRASIMKKTGATSLPALARLAFVVTWNGADSTFSESADCADCPEPGATGNGGIYDRD